MIVLIIGGYGVFGSDWPSFLAAVLRFPAANDDIEVEVTKTVTPQGETWLRRFGGSTFKSHLAATDDGSLSGVFRE